MEEEQEQQEQPEPEASAPNEEEIRARLEEQLRKVRVQDLLLETAVSVINLSARRIAKEDERDLGQARVGIEAVRSLVDLLDPEPGAQVRNALSEIQVLYARHAGGGGAEGAPAGDETSGDGEQQPQPPPTGQGPSRLWTPGSG